MREERVSVRHSIAWGAVAFGVTLAVVIGLRLDQAALAVVVGVACGVLASIPTGLLIVSLMRRRDTKYGRERGRDSAHRTAQSPPVVVVAPPAAPQLPQTTGWAGNYAAPLPTQRQFAVIGEEELEDGINYWQE